jgi:hypothetical protein
VTAKWKAGDTLPSFALPLTLRRAVQAVAGTRDYYEVHHDIEAAKASGTETVFFNTMFLQALANRAVTDWFGYDAFLRRCEVRMSAPNYLGRTLTVNGAIETIREDGGTMLDVVIQLATEEGDTTTILVTAQLPPAETPYRQYGG